MPAGINERKEDSLAAPSGPRQRNAAPISPRHWLRLGSRGAQISHQQTRADDVRTPFRVSATVGRKPCTAGRRKPHETMNQRARSDAATQRRSDGRGGKNRWVAGTLVHRPRWSDSTHHFLFFASSWRVCKFIGFLRGNDGASHSHRCDQ